MTPEEAKKLGKLKILYFQDPGHGWFQVPISLVQQLKLTPSLYSYYDRAEDFIYLEEDCDAPKFDTAMKAAGLNYYLVDVHLNEESRIRDLPAYKRL